jgi:hypothetical protein
LQFIQRWSHNLHQRPQWDSILAPGLIVTMERGNRLVRVDPVTGALLWEMRVGSAGGWLAATTTAIGYLSQHRQFLCVDVTSGAILWERQLGDHRDFYGRLVATDEYLLVGAWRGYTPLHCIDTQTGIERWRTSEPRTFAPPIPGPWGVAVAERAARELLLLDPPRGSTLQRFPLPAGVRESDYRSSVQRYGSALLATTVQGDLLLLDPAVDHGWRRIGFHDEGITSVRPTLLDD